MKRPEFDESKVTDKEYLKKYYAEVADYYDTMPGFEKVAKHFRKGSKKSTK